MLIIQRLLWQLGLGALFVAAVVSGFHFYKKSLIEETQKEVIEEVIKQDKDQYIETRKRIDKAVTNNSTVDAARERLQQRQERRKAE